MRNVTQSKGENDLKYHHTIFFNIPKYYPAAAAAAAKSLQSCPTLCDPIDSSPLGSPAPGILRARTLEWVAISFSSAWKEKWKWSRSVVSDPQRHHGLQPTRLLHPWDFPGKSAGVGVPLPSPSTQQTGGGNGNQLQYSCLDNSMERGAHGVAKSWIRLSNWAHMHTANNQE